MENTIWIGTRKGLVQYKQDDEGSWSLLHTHFAGEPVSMFLKSSGGSLYAALNLGHFGPKLHRSDNGGETWEEITVPAFPASELAEENANKEKGKSVQQLWILENGVAEGELWTGTLPCGLFHSTDKGQSWELINSLTDMENATNWFGGGYDDPGIHSIAINPDQPEQIRVAISCGGVWESNDKGKHWESRTEGMRAGYMPPEQAFEPDAQDPHRMIACPANRDRLWVQHHNGIFNSADGGKHWTEIEQAGPSVFGFTVAVHPYEKDTAWFVPGVKDECRMPVDNKLVVTRTRDGGKSFDVLSNGLPTESFDLIYRHGLAIGTDGQCLAMGSTSGNLWYSADQGDNWQELSHNLAPVYCVAFT